MEWTNEKPKEMGLYLRSNPVVQRDITEQVLCEVEGCLMTLHPQNDSGRLIPVDEMPDSFLWLKIPYPPHYKK